MDKMMEDVVMLYGELRTSLTPEEMQKIYPHLKALKVRLKEIKMERSMTSLKGRMDVLDAFIHGELKRIDENKEDK